MTLLALLPFALTAFLAAAIRWTGGPERGARLAGIAVAAGFLISWGWVLRPGWVPHEPLSRVGHIAFVAALVGLCLDLLGLRRLWAALAAGVVVLAAVWASANGGLWPPQPVSWLGGLSMAALAVTAFLVLVRLDALASEGVSALVILIMLALGVAALGALAGDSPVALTALMLALALAGYLVVAAIAGVPARDAIVLGAGCAVLALAWAMAQRNAGSAVGLVFLALMLFADGTARRVPLPKARISALIYPLILAAISALPLGLALLVVFATSKS